MSNRDPIESFEEFLGKTPPTPPSQSGLDKPISWRTIFRAGFIWGAEYALLSLIEDAPAWLKVATIVSALCALATLEGEAWLNRRRKHLFAISFGTVAVIYLVFVGFAINHSAERQANRRGLEKIYTTAGELLSKVGPLAIPNPKITDAFATQFHSDMEKWKTESSDWIASHLGQTAKDRFLDPVGTPYVYWNVASYSHLQLTDDLNTILGLRRNLSAMIETGAYEKN